jgi:predicted phage terminase large subunit-like protein
MTNAKKKVGSIKQIFDTNGLLQLLYPEVINKGDRPWSAECLVLNRTLSDPEGTFEPAGTGTATTSRHYDIIIEDDTVAPDYDQMTGEIQQPTQAEIEKAIGWHKMCHPLLVHPTKSQIIIVGTRWAKEDLIGWIQENSPNYKLLSRSAREVPGKIGVAATKEQGGVAVWDRFSDEVLTELELALGPFMFALLYLNIADSCDNIIFKRAYIQYYDTIKPGLMYCTTLDPAPSDSTGKNTDSDYNAILTTAIDVVENKMYVVHYNQVRADPGEVIDLLFNHVNAYKPSVVRVESVAYQKTLIYWIRKRQYADNNMFYIEEVKNARVSKSARILALQPWFAAGHVFMKRHHQDLERQLMSFNPAKSLGHDDIIDALSMHVDFWSKSLSLRREEEKQRVNTPAYNDASGVLEELLGRCNVTKKAPYDIGNMRQRALGKLPRKEVVHFAS